MSRNLKDLILAIIIRNQIPLPLFKIFSLAKIRSVFDISNRLKYEHLGLGVSLFFQKLVQTF